MSVLDLIVDNKVFLMGLDDLFREIMKKAERTELLPCARRVCEVLEIEKADVPVEGYYYEDAELTEYFLRMRALQAVERGRRAEVDHEAAFIRLNEVTSSALFGDASDGDKLLPQAIDPLAKALRQTPMNDWSLERLTAAASQIAEGTDDHSLVGLASLAKDPWVLAALRETVALYGAMLAGGAPDKIVYHWTVDPLIVDRSKRFIADCSALFDAQIPEPCEENAETYWNACSLHEAVGRCISIGCDDTVRPNRYYHWAIHSETEIHEFWKDELWTTQRYRKDVLDEDDESIITL
ncbi:MAG: hypothetical protein AAGI54_08375 [Planctomycetota bacterium]